MQNEIVKKLGKKNTLSGKKGRGKLWTLFEDD
jgi:hypothetical protein